MSNYEHQRPPRARPSRELASRSSAIPRMLAPWTKLLPLFYTEIVEDFLSLMALDVPGRVPSPFYHRSMLKLLTHANTP